LPLFPSLATDSAIARYYPHCIATSEIKFPKFSKAKVFSFAYSEIPVVNFYPHPAIVFNVSLSLSFPVNKPVI